MYFRKNPSSPSPPSLSLTTTHARARHARPQVYCCRPRGNSGYTYRESIPLGVTSLSPARVRSVVAVLQVQWAGESYDLLGRNCNHFCETFGEMLGVGPIPGWVNRFATNADATVTAVTYARDQIRVVGEEIGLAATAATNWLISGFTAAESGAGAGPHDGGGGGGAGAGGGGGGGGWDERRRGDFGGGGDEVEGGVGVRRDHVEGGGGGLGAEEEKKNKKKLAPPPGAAVDDLDDDGATTTENSTPRSSTARDAAGGEVTQIAAAVEVYT